MKNIKILLALISILLIFTTLKSNAQGYEIKVRLEGKQTYDSLKLRTFDGKSEIIDKQAAPFAANFTFKNKKSLPAGIYYINGDSTILCEFLISNDKEQKFSINILEDSVIFTGSIENAANMQYRSELGNFSKQLKQLDVEFNEMKQNNLPQYMLQPFVEKLMERAEKISTDKATYQRQKADEYKDYLLGSIILSTMELPNPPQEIYGNRLLIEKYMAEHMYDNYAWHDERMISTPIAVNKHKQFATTLYYLDVKDGSTALSNALKGAHANPKVYFSFFDQLGKVLGEVKSPYRVEGLYIQMLKDALAYDQTDKTRRTRYEAELKHIDKNLDGSILPNFNILMANGDTTTLYDVQSPYMLLYFQHPECPTCRQARNQMKDYPFLNQAIADKKIVVLTVYFEKDKKVFDDFLVNEANPNWLNSWNYDNQIEKEELFYLVTIPYMFLVDKDKRVIKKDILINEIEDYVKSLK